MLRSTAFKSILGVISFFVIFLLWSQQHADLAGFVSALYLKYKIFTIPYRVFDISGRTLNTYNIVRFGIFHTGHFA